jgi:hypothetical protein
VLGGRPTRSASRSPPTSPVSPASTRSTQRLRVHGERPRRPLFRHRSGPVPAGPVELRPVLAVFAGRRAPRWPTG